MSIKNYLAAGLAIGITVGTATIANDVGMAIDRSSSSKRDADRQRLKQQQKEWQNNQEVELAIIDEKIAVKETALEVLKYTIPVTILIVIGNTMRLYHGWVSAETRKAMFQATQIKMDPITRTYPVVCFEANGKFRLHDPNNKTTISMDRDSEAVPLLVNHSTAVQLQTLASGNQKVNMQALVLGSGD